MNFDYSIFDSFDMSVFTFFGEHIHSAIMNYVVEFVTFFGGGSFVTPMAVLGAILILFNSTLSLNAFTGMLVVLSVNITL